MKYKFGVSFATVLGVLTILRPLFAHHGSSVSYDLANRVTLKGTVTEFAWSNPHTQVYFDVKDEKGNIAHWGGEMNSPGVLARSGWTRHSLQPGDQVTITIAPSKAPNTHVGLVGKVVLPNGQALEGNQVLRPGANGAE
jgi:hypothetical protein